MFRFNRNIESLCFGMEAKQPKQTVSKQTKKTEKNEKIETSKLSISVLKRNKRNEHFVSDSAETSFGSSFGRFESKLASKNTLLASVGLRIQALKINPETLCFLCSVFCVSCLIIKILNKVNRCRYILVCKSQKCTPT